MPRSLRWRSIALFLPLFFITLTVVGFVLAGASRRDAQRALEDRLQLDASVLREPARQAFASHDTAALQTAVEEVLTHGDRFVLLDKTGSVMLLVPPQSAGAAGATALGAAISGKPAQAVIEDPETGESRFYSASPITDQGKQVGVMALGASREAIGAASRRIGATLAAAAGAATVAALLAAWLISRDLRRTLAPIAAAAKKIGDGDLEERVQGSALAEAMPLALAFDEMAASLADQVGEGYRERDTLGAVLDSMADALLVVDRDGGIIIANPEAVRLFHIEPETIPGKNLLEAVRDHEIQRIAEAAQREGRLQTARVEYAPGVRMLKITATPIRGHGESLVLLLVQDLTEMQRLEAVRREFVANASHELRTPLAAVKAAVETLENGALDDPPAAKEFLGRINIEVDHLTQLVQAFLDLSRLETGRAQFTYTRLDVAKVLAETVERVRLQARQAKITVNEEYPAGLAAVRADRAAVHEIMLNLLGNAIKFTPSGGAVTVGARDAGTMVEVTVRDTGVGISAEDALHIFERFYKVDRSRSSAGTGLGLALTKHMVQAHGGLIWVETALGQGAAFHYTLPKDGPAPAGSP